MNSFSDSRSRNHQIDMATRIDIKGSSAHFDAAGLFLRDDFAGPRELCDVHLRFGTDNIRVHSVMLSAYATVFARKFTMANKSYHVDLSFLEKNSVQRVVDFIYKGQVSLHLSSLSDDLEAINYFGVGKLQEEVEKQLILLANSGTPVEVLNIVTANLKTIPHSTSTIVAISDETVRDLVVSLHKAHTSHRLPYEELLRLSTNTVITMISSRVDDSKKVDIINIALKWIYERRLNDQKASNILRALTFGSMKYAQLVHFRNSLIQTAVPVTIGRCVRLARGDHDTLDIVLMHAENSGYAPAGKTTTTSFSLNSDPTAPLRIGSSSNLENSTACASSSSDYSISDCVTAMSFDAEDLKRLGFEIPKSN